jgi:hypothetical protein
MARRMAIARARGRLFLLLRQRRPAQGVYGQGRCQGQDGKETPHGFQR